MKRYQRRKPRVYRPRHVSRRTLVQGLAEEIMLGDSVAKLYASLLAEHLIAHDPKYPSLDRIYDICLADYGNAGKNDCRDIRMDASE
jgi:hypothetical protein